MNIRRRPVAVFLVCALAVAATAASAHEQVRIVGNMAISFSERPTASDAVEALGDPDQPVFYGPGWEVVLDHVGFGGNYMVTFSRDPLDRWSVDWMTEGLFLSYHPVGAGHVVDPFVHIAVGSAGRAVAEQDSHDVDDPVALSIFPMFSAGLAFDLHGFLFGGRLAYVPEAGAPPWSDLEAYPVDRFQAAFYGGIALGGHQGRGSRRARPR
jgi:hypothetical protein